MKVTQKELSSMMSGIEKQVSLAQSYVENDDMENATKAMDKADALKAEYELNSRIYKAQSEDAPSHDEIEQVVKTESTFNAFAMVVKLINNKKLNDVEKSALVANTEVTSTHGENYILPEEINNEIKVLRGNFKSAKDLVSVTPVSALTGADTYETTDNGTLYPLTDGDEFDETESIKFASKPWAIEFFGKLIPVSNILIGAEKGGLLAYLNRWFVRSAIRTENGKIFDKLRADFTIDATPINSLAGLATILTKKLDPDFLVDTVIVTNQTGYDHMIQETDANGRPMLTPDLINPLVMRYLGHPVTYFSDAQLPNQANGNAPVFVGSIKAGLEMKEYLGLQFAVSDEVFFKRNQRAMRVLEGFALVAVDKRAVHFVEYKAPTAKVVNTKAVTDPAVAPVNAQASALVGEPAGEPAGEPVATPTGKATK